MTVISSNQTTTQVLTTTDPNLTVDASGSITTATTDAVDGYSGGAWTVTNYGALASSGPIYTYGIYLTGASNTIDNYGHISGAGGIQLSTGGSVTNEAGATIAGTGATTSGISSVSGIHVGGGGGTVSNSGTITANGYGVGLDMGGHVTNYASGSITGAEDAIFFYGAAGTLDNYGNLIATIDDGVGFFAGGSMINEAGATVTCNSTTAGTSPAACYFQGFSGSLQNDGSMTATDYGAYLGMGGSVVNGAKNSTALLDGGIDGVYISGAAGTVTNAGAITGTTNSIDFAFASTANLLIVDPGAVFNGAVLGGTGTLELAKGASAGTLSGTIGATGSFFQNFSALVVDAGAAWTLSGASDSIANLTDNGSLIVTGALQATAIQLNGTLEVASDSGSASAIHFGGGGKLVIDNAASFSGPVLTSFGVGNTVDIHNFAAAGAKISYDAATGVATISNGAHTATLNFDPATLGMGTLAVISDGGTGVDIGLAPLPPTITVPVLGSVDATTATPIISGTGVTGDTVNVTLNGTLAGTATVDANGGWSVTPTSLLANGVYTASATEVNSAGPSAPSNSDTFTVAQSLATAKATSFAVDGSSQTLAFTLNTTAAVNVAAGATLSLSNGATATLWSGSGTNAPVFTYAAASGQNIANISVTGYTGAITDSIGNALGAITNASDAVALTTGAATAGSGAMTVGGNGAWGEDIVSQAYYDVVNLLTNSRMDLIGLHNGVVAATNSTVGISGDNNGVWAAPDVTIWLRGNGDLVHAAGDSVFAADGGSVTIGGNGATGADDMVIANANALTLQTNSRMDVAGSGNTITVAANATLGVEGSNNTITTATGDSIWLNSGAGNIVDVGSSEQIGIWNFSQAPGGVVDLLQGAGGYTSAGSVVSALTSDGHGGMTLALGANGSIEFANVAPGTLTSANFKIG